MAARVQGDDGMEATRKAASAAQMAADEAALDDTYHGEMRGMGILAKQSELEDDDRFAQGCRLLLYIARHDVSTVKSIVSATPSLVNFRDYDRRSPLHVAASEGVLALVEFLIEAGSKLSPSDRWGGSPLDDAHRHQHEEVIDVLRTAGAKAGLGDRSLALIAAAASGDSAAVMELLDDGAPVDAGDYDARTPLHLAAGGGHMAVLDILLKRGADIHKADRWGNTAVDDALRDDVNGPVATRLLELGSKPKPMASLVDVTESGASHKGPTTTLNALKNSTMLIDLNDIEIGDKIGGGSFGVVYKARWHQTPVAAKCVRAKEADRSLARADFLVEASILSQLRHPNICMLLGFSVREGREVMISELMRCSLLDVLKSARTEGHPIATGRALRYMLELARGMHYLHSCNPPVLHRDLKPANLLIDGSNTIRISDFGLATLRRIHPPKNLASVAPNDGPPQAMSHDHPAGAAGAPPPKKRAASLDDSSSNAVAAGGEPKVMARRNSEQIDLTGETGSYRFMAPEIYMYQPYGRPVDVYSFAMITYNCLVATPWADLSGERAVQLACDGDRPLIPRGWDERISKLLHAAWASQPEARPSFDGVLDIFHQLEAIIEAQPDALKHNSAGCQCAIS